MKYTHLFFSIMFFCLVSKNTLSQTTTGTNARPSTPAFTGWDASGVSGSLEVRNDFNDNINFFTNGNQQATILANGNVGIGTPTPTARLTTYYGAPALTTSSTGNLF